MYRNRLVPLVYPLPGSKSNSSSFLSFRLDRFLCFSGISGLSVGLFFNQLSINMMIIFLGAGRTRSMRLSLHLNRCRQRNQLRCHSYQDAALPRLQCHAYGSSCGVIGDAGFISDSMLRDVSIHILMWVGHLKAYWKPTRPLIAISRPAGIQRCKLSRLHYGFGFSPIFCVHACSWLCSKKAT